MQKVLEETQSKPNVLTLKENGTVPSVMLHNLLCFQRIALLYEETVMHHVALGINCLSSFHQ